MKLDSTSFEKELEQQNISLANAQTGVIQAESNLKSAEATKKEYEEGTYLQEKLDLQNKIYDGDAAILKATQDLKSARNKLDHDTKLQAKGYQTTRQLENSRNSVDLCLVKLQQGELQKELAEEKLRVLETISFEKQKVHFYQKKRKKSRLRRKSGVFRRNSARCVHF